MARLVVVLFCEINVIHLFTVLVHSPVLAIEIHDAALIGTLIQVQICQMAQRMNVCITDMRSRLKRIVVVGRCFENEALILVTGFDVKELGLHGIVITHLVAGDVIETALSVGIAVIAVLIAVSRSFHPKRSIGMEKLNVCAFVSIPVPILYVVSTHRHHWDGV